MRRLTVPRDRGLRLDGLLEREQASYRCANDPWVSDAAWKTKGIACHDFGLTRSPDDP